MISYQKYITTDGNVFIPYDGYQIGQEIYYNGFDAKEEVENVSNWIREYFAISGGEVALIGISGGKDSSVAAALCVKALGKDNVIGVKMPNGVQQDADEQQQIIDFLDIQSIEVNIKEMYDAFINNASGWIMNKKNFLSADNWNYENIENNDYTNYKVSTQARINLPARIRMTTLYLISQTLNDQVRVANTCNLSENTIGYSTRWGDNIGDFAPLEELTATEVCAMGYVLGIPENLLDKAPSDGLCGKTDEDNLGFTYDELDAYIRTGVVTIDNKERFDDMHGMSRFKMNMPPAYNYKKRSVIPEGLFKPIYG